jgi:dipeptidyl aminopeptidase/acylaminoacyl peptidase
MDLSLNEVKLHEAILAPSSSQKEAAMPARSMRLRTLATLLLVASLPAAGSSQARRAMSPLDLIEIPRVLDPQLSPDGSQVLYVKDAPDWKANRRVGHVWRVDADGSDAKQLTFGERGESSPRWSPDGTRIAFLTRRGDDEEAQLYVIENDGGEARRLTRHPSAVSSIGWAPDGKSIFFLAPEPKTQDEKDRERLRDDVYAFEENFKHRHLWKAAAESGETSRVTSGDYSILAYALSDDGSRIAFHRAVSPLMEHGPTSEVWTMNADGSGAVQLTHNGVAESNARFSPDNSQLLFVSGANAAFDTYYNDNLFIVPASGGPARQVAPDMPDVEGGAAWAAGGRSIYFVANLGVHSELMQIDLATKATRQLTNGQHAIQGWDYVPSAGRHIFQVDEAARYGEVWTLAADGSGTRAQVTHVYDEVAARFALPTQERIEWKGADGVRVEGLLYYPIDYAAGTRYPLVVQTHGGPAASDKFGFGSWNSYVQVLTGRGYAVLKPNYRGSTGYGNAFLRDMVGHYFNQAHLDVLAGVDRVIAMGVADPDRLAKMGWSAGGHMTNRIITFTDRFKAASSGAGASNWISMYAQSDVRAYRTPWFGAAPWGKDAPIDKYWNDSPLKYVSNVRTPTLFIVGEADVRVPPPQSVEMHRALKHNGVPTHLYLAPREPHGWTELRHQLFKINVELEWFERHVTGRPYTWTTAPGDPPRAAAPRPTTSQQPR